MPRVSLQLGTLANFSGTSLNSGAYFVAAAPGASAKLQFTGADIVTNAGTIVLSGPGAAIMDEDGVNALTNFSHHLNFICFTDGATIPERVVALRILIGDSTGDGMVGSSDIGQTKAQSGSAAGATNFRTDINTSGAINASDLGQVKSNSGHSVGLVLPTPTFLHGLAHSVGSANGHGLPRPLTKR